MSTQQRNGWLPALLALPVLCCVGHAVLLAVGVSSVTASAGGATGTELDLGLRHETGGLARLPGARNRGRHGLHHGCHRRERPLYLTDFPLLGVVRSVLRAGKRSQPDDATASRSHRSK